MAEEFILNNDFTFIDITEKPNFEFADNVNMHGLSFRHVYKGVYKISPIQFSESDFEEILKQFEGVVFVARVRSNIVTPLYAMNKIWCDIDPSYIHYEDVVLDYIAVNTNESVILNKNSSDSDFYRYDKSYKIFVNAECTCNLGPVNRSTEPLGIRKLINIGGYYGYLVEDATYYFPECAKFKGKFALSSSPKVDLNMVFDIKCSMIGFSVDIHPSMTCGIEFLAVGDEACDRLKYLFELRNDSSHFYHVFPTEEVKPINFEDLLKATRSPKPEEFVVPNNAIELIKGYGYNDYHISYKSTVSDGIITDFYSKAFVIGHTLYLVHLDNITEVDLRKVVKLVVTKNIKLKCTDSYPFTCLLIDKEDEFARKLESIKL